MHVKNSGFLGPSEVLRTEKWGYKDTRSTFGVRKEVLTWSYLTLNEIRQRTLLETRTCMAWCSVSQREVPEKDVGPRGETVALGCESRRSLNQPARVHLAHPKEDGASPKKLGHPRKMLFSNQGRRLELPPNRLVELCDGVPGCGEEPPKKPPGRKNPGNPPNPPGPPKFELPRKNRLRSEPPELVPVEPAVRDPPVGVLRPIATFSPNIARTAC